jgi:hypothetical protein
LIEYIFENIDTKDINFSDYMKSEDQTITLEGKGCGDSVSFNGGTWVKKSDNPLAEFFRMLTKSSSTKEKIVSNILTKLGFIKKEKGSGIISADIRNFYWRNKFGRDCIEYIPDLSSGMFFVEQPFGTQEAPDFFIFYYGWFFPLELKSAKEGRVILNSHIPRFHKNFLYCFTSTKDKTSILLRGTDLINKNQLEILKKYSNDYRELVSNTNLTLEKEGSIINTYDRLMVDFNCNFNDLCSLADRVYRDILLLLSGVQENVKSRIKQ